MQYKVWDEITYPFPNFNAAPEVWEWISSFIPHFTGHVIIMYPCRDLSQLILVKGVAGGTLDRYYSPLNINQFCYIITGLILGLRPANERRRYKVTTSLIGWVQT